MSIFIVSDRQTAIDNSQSFCDKIFHKSVKKQKPSKQINVSVLGTGYYIERL